MSDAAGGGDAKAGAGDYGGYTQEEIAQKWQEYYAQQAYYQQQQEMQLQQQQQREQEEREDEERRARGSFRGRGRGGFRGGHHGGGGGGGIVKGKFVSQHSWFYQRCNRGQTNRNCLHHGIVSRHN